MIIVKLPCTNLVAHFLKKEYGNPVIFKGRNGMARLFYRMLERPSHWQDTKASGYENMVHVVITTDDFSRYGCELSLSDIMEFNNVATDRIHEMMAMSIETQMETIKDRTIKDSIFWWCDHFDFPQEILSFDAAKKAYWRYRKRMEGDTDS